MKITDHNIICDNPICDYKCEIEVKDMQTYIGKSCPECGENLLTDEDFDHHLKLLAIAKKCQSEGSGELSDTKHVLSVKGGKFRSRKV